MEKEDDAYDYGSYPPVNDASLTYRTWERCMGPWTPGSGNAANRMTQEEQKLLVDHLRPMFEANDQASK